MPVKNQHLQNRNQASAASSSSKNKGEGQNLTEATLTTTVSVSFYKDDHIVGGRTPVILHYESGSDSSSSLRDGYSSSGQPHRSQPFRRPPPYRSVPLSWTVADCSRRARCQDSNRHPPVSMNTQQRDGRAKSVPPQWRTVSKSEGTSGGDNSIKGNCCKPPRPKSIHQELPVTGQSRPMWNGPSPATFNQCGPNRQNQQQQQPKTNLVAPFPQSVSLQFDMLVAPDWCGGALGQLPVPSPAPTERRSMIRTSVRTSASGISNSSLSDQRSSSVPRSQHIEIVSPIGHPSASTSSSSLASMASSSAGRPSRPLSHPASSAMPSSRSHWTLSSSSSQHLHGSTGSVSALPTARSHGHLNRHQQPQQHLLTPPSQKPLLPLPLPPQRHQWTTGRVGSGGGGYSNGWSGIASATPAPAPSPSSTPSPSGRPLAHLPNDALLRSSHPGLRLLEKKLDLYADIVHAQEKFVQVRQTEIVVNITKGQTNQNKSKSTTMHY